MKTVINPQKVQHLLEQSLLKMQALAAIDPENNNDDFRGTLFNRCSRNTGITQEIQISRVLTSIVSDFENDDKFSFYGKLTFAELDKAGFVSHDSGLCYNFLQNINPCLTEAIFIAWPKFSGCCGYPVPNVEGVRDFESEIGVDHIYQHCKEEGISLYEGAYGEARIELFNFYRDTINSLFDIVEE